MTMIAKIGREKKSLIEKRFLPINLSTNHVPFSIDLRIDSTRSRNESKRNLIAPLNLIGGFLFRGID